MSEKSGVAMELRTVQKWWTVRCSSL